jgi:uncharacterized repeat protein (TIGR02543 family)
MRSVDCPQCLRDIYSGRATGGTCGGSGPQPTTYTITFNVNGGNALNPATATTGPNGRLTSLPTPTRSGHTFDGWFTAATGGTAVNTNTVFNSNTTIFARWTVTATTYNITLNVNGGDAINPSTLTTGTNGRLTNLPTPTRSGHSFNGWFTAATGGTVVNTNTVFTANATIFAQWTATTVNTRTVTYNINGGTGTTPASQTVNAGSSVALANGTGFTRSGFTFGGWNTNQAGTGTNYNAGTSFTPTANVTLFARWNTSTTGPTRRDTTKVEAESLTGGLPTCNASASSNPMCISTANGITNIGWINGGDVANYSVNVPRAGAYTIVFRVANGMDGSNFTVRVNGSQVGGDVRVNNTGSWDTYLYVTHSPDAQFNAGANTVQLNFGGPVNVDYFLLLGEPVASVRPVTVPRQAAVTAVTLRTSAGGFTAMLPANHAYTSYKLIDVQGRVLKRGMVSPSVSDLRFDGVKNSVVFLRLEGRNGAATVVRAVTY